MALTRQHIKTTSLFRVGMSFLRSFTWLYVSQTFLNGGTPKIIVYIPPNPCLWKNLQYSKQRQLVTYGDYSSIANCRTKLPVIFRGIFGNPRDILKLLFVYFIISRRTSIAFIRIVVCAFFWPAWIPNEYPTVQYDSTWAELNFIFRLENYIIYEGWNFNSGNYLFTTDTK